jgi:hypothetical protein
LSETAKTAPTQRDRHLGCIADKGRLGWQKAAGYSTRSRIEGSVIHRARTDWLVETQPA